MNNINDILKSIHWSENLTRSFGINSQLSEIIKNQENTLSKLNGTSMLTGITKSINYYKPYFNTIDTITKSLDWHTKLGFPNTLLDSISSITQQHEALFGNIRSFTEAISVHQPMIDQINSLQFALSGISGQMLSTVATQKKWDLLDDFEEISEEAVTLQEKFIDNEGITYEDLEEIKVFLQRIEVKVDKIDNDANAFFWRLLVILGFIFSLMGEVRNWTHKPEYATKEEIQNVIKEQFDIYESKLKEQKEYRITNRKCKVMLKPKSKTLLIETLPEGFEVVVLQIHHKWAYVSYFDSKSNLPQTGWIMKKYLNKP